MTPLTLKGRSMISKQPLRKKVDGNCGLQPRRGPPVLRARYLKDIAGQLKERRGTDFGLTNFQSELVVKDVLDIVQDILENGDDVMFRGFGKFSVANAGPRIFRNPQTGEKFKKDNVVSVKFTPSPKLKEAVKSARSPEPKK